MHNATGIPTDLILTKESPSSEIKAYFETILRLSKQNDIFPVDLESVWPLVYSRKEEAARALKENFFENEDFVLLRQNAEQTGRGGHNKITYMLSVSCLEYFIARKVRPVFEVYRRVFHHAVNEKIEFKKPDTLSPIAKELNAAIRIARCLGLKDNQAILSANRVVKVITGTDCMQLMDVTHLESKDQEQHFIPSEIGNTINGQSARKVNQLLHEYGFQTEYRDHKDRKKWKPTEKGEPFAVFKDTGKVHSDGTPVRQLFWKESIIDALRKEAGLDN